MTTDYFQIPHKTLCLAKVPKWQGGGETAVFAGYLSPKFCMIYFIRNLFGMYSPPRGKNNSFCKIVGGEANRVYYGGIEIRELPLIAYPRYQGSLLLVPLVGENPGNEVTLAAGSDEKWPVGIYLDCSVLFLNFHACEPPINQI